ncbi:hypothetical protein OROMI_007203 [Orobanche minor]
MSSGGGDGHKVAEFQLSESSILKIQKGDITRWSIDGSSDAIVNPANERMLGGHGADGSSMMLLVQTYAQRALVSQKCVQEFAAPLEKQGLPRMLLPIRVGTGSISQPEISLGHHIFWLNTAQEHFYVLFLVGLVGGFQLPASHVIHTVGPIYNVDTNPEASLRNAYRNCLLVAKDNNIQYIAFTAISCGAFGYPHEKAATVAISTVKKSTEDLKEVHFVLFSDEIYDVWLNKATKLLQRVGPKGTRRASTLGKIWKYLLALVKKEKENSV